LSDRQANPIPGLLLLALLAWLLWGGSCENAIVAPPTPGPRVVAILRESGDKDPQLHAALLQLRLEAGEQREVFLLDPDDDADPFVAAIKSGFEGSLPLPAIVIGVRVGDQLQVLHRGPCPRELEELKALVQQHGG